MQKVPGAGHALGRMGGRLNWGVQSLHLRVGGTDVSRINTVRRLMSLHPPQPHPPPPSTFPHFLSLEPVKTLAPHPSFSLSLVMAHGLLAFWLSCQTRNFPKSTNQPNKKKLKWDTTSSSNPHPPHPHQPHFS